MRDGSANLCKTFHIDCRHPTGETVAGRWVPALESGFIPHPTSTFVSFRTV